MTNRFVSVALLFLLATGVVGCSLIKQGREDYEVGKSTPIREGEASPSDQAKGWSSIVGSVVPAAQVPVATILTVLLTAWRGRKIRKNLPVSKQGPITGDGGAKIGLESVVQIVADVRAGLFDIGSPEGALRRGWKFLLIGALAFVVSWTTGNDFWGLLSLVLAGATEKATQKVLPIATEVKPSPTEPSQ